MRRSILRFTGVMALLLWAAVSTAQDAPAACTLLRGCMMVPVGVNGVGPYPLLLDLALPKPVLSPAVASFCKLSSAGDPPAVSVALALSPGVTVSTPALVAELTPLTERFGVKVAGLLPGCWPGYETRLDFGAQTVCWTPVAGAAPQDAATMPLARLEDGSPAIQVTIDRRTVRTMALDTTFHGLAALSRADAEALGLLRPEAAKLQSTPFFDDAGVLQSGETLLLRLEELSAGPVGVLGPAVYVQNAPSRLGMGFLRHCKLTLSPDAGTCRLEAAGAARWSAPRVTGYGLALRRCVKGVWELWVAKDSPASRADLRTGCKLKAIAGMDVTKASASALEQRLTARAGETISLEVDAPPLRQATLTAEALLP